MKSAKKMRKFLLTAAIAIALVGLTGTSAFAMGGRPGGCPGNNASAPLDGGILTLLVGGAAAAYFAIKKRKNN